MSNQSVQSASRASRQLRIATALFLLSLMTGAVGICFAVTADSLDASHRATICSRFILAAIILLFTSVYFYGRFEGLSRRASLISVTVIAALLYWLSTLGVL